MKRKEFIASLASSVVAGNAEAKKALSSELTKEQKEQNALEERVKPYGVTGKKLPMAIKAAVKGMPKGHELNNWQVVLVNDLNKWLDTLSKELNDSNLNDPAARKLARQHIAEVINGKFPIYLNGSHETVQMLIADPHGIEILKSYLLHERMHVIDMTAPHSRSLQLQYEFLQKKKNEGKILPRYHGFIDAVKKEAEKYHEIENRVSSK